MIDRTFPYRLVIELAVLFYLIVWAHSSEAASVDSLFKEAIKHGGFTEYCKKEECPVPAVVLAPLEYEGANGKFDIRHPTVISISPEHEGALGSHEWNSTLVHEFVHYLQWLTGIFKVNMSCHDKVRLIELPAYHAQAKYLSKHKIEYDYSFQMFIMGMGCYE
jgi:hypothetical protein